MNKHYFTYGNQQAVGRGIHFGSQREGVRPIFWQQFMKKKMFCKRQGST
jgi:hypothetical protein